MNYYNIQIHSEDGVVTPVQCQGRNAIEALENGRTSGVVYIPLGECFAIVTDISTGLSFKFEVYG